MKILMRSAMILCGALAVLSNVSKLAAAMPSEGITVPWIWGLSADGTALYREGVTTALPNGTKWTALAGRKLRSVAASADGRLWALAKEDGSVLFRKGITPPTPMGTDWVVTTSTEKFDQITVGKFNQLYALRNINTAMCYAWTYRRQGIDEKNPQGTVWTTIPNSGSNRALDAQGRSRTIANPMYISAGPNDAVYGCSYGSFAGFSVPNNIYKVAPAKNVWLDVPNGQLKQLDIGKDGILWGVNFANQIWMTTNPSANQVTWKLIDGALVWIACGPAGDVWGVNAQGMIWRRTGITKDVPGGRGWALIDGTLSQIDIGALPIQ